LGARKPTGLSSQLMPHMSEVEEPNISNTPCQCRNTDYWTDYNYIKKKKKKKKKKKTRKRRYQIVCARSVSRITFIWNTQYRNIRKPNN
jgi:hypothetical protein